MAVNHPNSFLDAIIIGSHFKQPVYFLARGDAFQKKWALKILTALKCIPVYRLREGAAYLHLNEDSFTRCREIFKQGGIVLIFSEGLCENEWRIRPLKKGTARLAFSSWAMPEIGEALKILPIGISYCSFNQLPKRVWINFGNYIHKSDFNTNDTEGNLFAKCNHTIKEQWQHLCIDGVKNDKSAKLKCANYLQNTAPAKFRILQKEMQSGNYSTYEALTLNSNQKIEWWQYFLFLLSIPALLCYYPFYLGLKKIIQAKAAKSVHYDSILFGVVTLGFSLLQLLYFLVLVFFTHNIYLSFAIICLSTISIYFLTKCYVLWHKILHPIKQVS